MSKCDIAGTAGSQADSSVSECMTASVASAHAHTHTYTHHTHLLAHTRTQLEFLHTRKRPPNCLSFLMLHMEAAQATSCSLYAPNHH
eukprot:scaffold59130_cov21-Tisochrysis_lutea.AAC.1